MLKRILIIFMLSLLIVACKGPTPIDWGDSGETTEFESVDSVDVNQTDPNSEPSNPADPDPVKPDSGSSSASRYDPNAPPPKITDSAMGSPWREFTKAPIQNRPGERSADAYLAVIEQFDVAKSYPCRYTTSCGGTSDTRCNIFASDVMNAMGAPLPTKGDLGRGHGTAKNTDPMPANAKDTHAWLEQQKDGWRKLDPNNPADWALLQQHVAAGKPALASHPDHIAVIRPDQPSNLAVGNTGGLHIAQAGAYNSNDTLVGTAYAKRRVDIYIHD
jgi:hypothetical protein